MSQRSIVTELPRELHNLARDISRLVYPARCEYLNRYLKRENTNVINRELQPKYGINKRQVNAIRIEIKGAVDSAKECRKNHLTQIKDRIKSIKSWLKEQQKKLAKLPLACCLRTRRTLQTNRRFAIHHKKRKLAQLENQLKHLKNKPISVTLGQKNTQYSTVGSSDEKLGNQITQYDGKNLIFRVPYALEAKYGKYIHAPLTFEYSKGQEWILDAIKNNRALSYRIYAKNLRWFIACSLDVPEPERVSHSRYYGCIGIDINPGKLGWAKCDSDGNLKAKGQIPLNLHSKRSNQQEDILQKAANQLVALAVKNKCPLVIEHLDFDKKKSAMKEQGRGYSRMLSGFSYGRLIELLEQKCELAGIELIKTNPAYSSLIGLVKFMRQYGLSSDTAAALTLARRVMGLSERIPSQNAYPALVAGKHVWTAWNVINRKLNKKLSLRRHQYFSLSNGQLEVMLRNEFLALAKKGSCSQKKRRRRSSKGG